MEIEVKEFGVRIRLFVEPVTEENTTDEMEKCEQCDEPFTSGDIDGGRCISCGTMIAAEPVSDVEPEPRSRGQLETGLRTWRRDEAIRRGIPTYIVMTERVIQTLVENPPRNLNELKKVKGVGPKTIEVYGERLMEIIWEAGNSEEE